MTLTNAYAHDMQWNRDRFVTATGGLRSDEPTAPQTLELGALEGISGGSAHTPPEAPTPPTGCILDGQQLPFPKPTPLPGPLPGPSPLPGSGSGPFNPNPSPSILDQARR